MSALLPSGRRRRGPLEAALERALAAQARRETPRGTGDELADVRRALRDAALAVDLARADAQNGGSRHTLALCVRTFVDLRLTILPLDGPTDDPLRALVDAALRAEAGDTAQP